MNIIQMAPLRGRGWGSGDETSNGSPRVLCSFRLTESKTDGHRVPGSCRVKSFDGRPQRLSFLLHRWSPGVSISHHADDRKRVFSAAKISSTLQQMDTVLKDEKHYKVQIQIEMYRFSNKISVKNKTLHKLKWLKWCYIHISCLHGAFVQVCTSTKDGW